MKKIISIIVIVSLLLTAITAVAYASNTITVAASVNNTTKAVTIAGNASSGQGHRITVLVVNPSGGTDYVDQTTGGADGSYQFSYVLDESVGGTYTVSVRDEAMDSPETAAFTYTPNRAGHTHSSSNGSTPALTPADGTYGNTQLGTDGTIIATPELKDSRAIVTISADDIAKAAEKAAQDSDGVKLITIKVNKVDGASEYVQELPAAAITAAAGQKLQIITEIGTITIPSNMLAASEAANGDKVSISIRKADTGDLDAVLKNQIGDRPVLEISLKVNDTARAWNNADAPVTVSMPYTPSAAELADYEHIVILYIDSSGKGISVPTGKYDAASGMVSFKTTHLSKYATAFVKRTFGDIGSYTWAKKSIEVMASKGVISGTSTDTYTPGAAIKRSDFMLLLVKALGLSASADGNFSDVAPTAYYAEALAIAKKLGIAAGVGDNEFNPDAEISRQDMMVLIDKAITAAKKNLAAGTAADLDAFADKASVASYAEQSISILIKNGIVAGDGTNINPRGNATRAETAVLIYKIYNK